MKKYFLLVLLSIVSACFKKPSDPIPRYQPKIGDRFEWRLDSIGLNEVSQYHCTLIDIDAFSATKELVDAFHARGIKVIAYVSVGTFEEYRPDRNVLPAEIIGSPYPDWPDELFLNLREIEKMKPFITARFDMIKAKGFDGIEADNIDIYGEEKNFNLTLEDTQAFCEWMVQEAHARGLSIGQKNTEELVPLMYKKFDWALTEDVFHQHNEEEYSLYISAGKPVFSAEYTDELDIKDFNRMVCPKANQLRYYPFLKHRDLTQWTYVCNP